MQETIEKSGNNSPASPAPRTDRLELVKELVRGSIGVVHKARNPQLGRLIALRQFDVPQWLDDVNELLKKILAEARAASALEHPNIARLYTCGYKNFTVFLTAEFVEGQTLKELMASRPLEQAEILPLAKQLCAALDYAHEKGVVHHFLNPCNIKVLPDSTLKILDFGLLRDKNLLSQTPVKKLEDEPYLSPEQVRNKAATKASNLFSAASILYELYTGRNPFAGKHLGEVDRAITDINPHPLNVAHPRVSPAVSAVILKALSKSPEERFSSGQELIEALNNATAAKAEPAKPVVQPRPAAPKTTAAEAAKPNSSQAVPPVPPSKTSTQTLPVAPPPAAKVQVGTVNQGKLIGIVVGCLVAVAVFAFVFQRKPSPVPEPAPEPVAVPIAQPSPVADVPVQPAAEDPAPSDDSAVAENSVVRPTYERRSRARSAAPAARAAADGQISISAVPADALVTIEGQAETLRTPLTIPVAPGSYKISISKPGYATDTRIVQISSGGRALVDVRLTAVQGWLNVAGSPAGASVWIDGKDTGKITPATLVLDPALHRVLLRKTGYLDAGSNIQLAAGQTTGYSPTLMVAGRTDSIKIVGGGIGKFLGGNGSAQGKARIEIKSDPKGAQVTINGTSLQKTTPVEVQVEPGNYEITIEKDGYQSVHENAIVGVDDHVKINRSLTR